MKKVPRVAIIFGVVVFLIGAASWGYYRNLYPYGHTHRCSKVLSMELLSYADDHDGRFPSSEQDAALGLTGLLDFQISSLDRIVGKAGDLDVAREFYEKYGFITSEHTSWHYVEGLTVEDVGRALAWDKIPLGHNGQRLDYNPREVIMVDGSVIQVNQDKWAEFLISQRELSERTE